ncbi:MAG: GYDIA family GHMP kinase [Bacteroidota bacterium]
MLHPPSGHPPSVPQNYRANGKLLLSGEYFVLDGALALALPTQRGQTLTLQTLQAAAPHLHWKSWTVDGTIWFDGVFDLKNFAILSHSDEATAQRLQAIFQAIRQLRSDFLLSSNAASAWEVNTHLDFPRDWGLGSSSTLLHLLAQWAQVDPYALLAQTFGGSGYDLACASANGPILYQKKGGKPIVQACHFQPVFRSQLYFVYLGQKQNSRQGIAHYRQQTEVPGEHIKHISVLTKEILNATTLQTFECCIEQHEELVAQHLQLDKVKDRYFSDYWGTVKSLGAWGGDFVMVSSPKSEKATRDYFADKGFSVFIPYQTMILDHNE